MFLLTFHSWELRAPRPAVHFLLIENGRKDQVFADSRADPQETSSNIGSLRRAAARRRLPFMFGRQSAAAISRTTYCAIIQLSTRV